MREQEQTWNDCQGELFDLVLWLAVSCNQKTGPVTKCKITVIIKCGVHCSYKFQ